MGAGVLPTYWDCQTPATWFTYGSNHAGMVNFAFCDGSVRSITKVQATDQSSMPPPDPPTGQGTARWNAFQYLAGMKDGVTPDSTQLGVVRQAIDIFKEWLGCPTGAEEEAPLAGRSRQGVMHRSAHRRAESSTKVAPRASFPTSDNNGRDCLP